MKEIRYERENGLCLTHCETAPAMVGSIHCKEYCPHYHGPGSGENTILCGKEDV